MTRSPYCGHGPLTAVNSDDSQHISAYSVIIVNITLEKYFVT